MILIKQNGPIAPKIINELPSPTNQLLVTQMLSKAKIQKTTKIEKSLMNSSKLLQSL